MTRLTLNSTSSTCVVNVTFNWDSFMRFGEIFATRCLVHTSSFICLFVFNALSSVRRNAILTAVAEKKPELYRFVLDSLECNTTLTYGDNIIISAEGSQQEDTLSGFEYCNTKTRSRPSRHRVHFLPPTPWSVSAAFSKSIGLSNCEQAITSHRSNSTRRSLCLPPPHSGDWLQASPKASVGFLLSDGDSILSGTQSGHQSGHLTRTCDKAVDARGLYWLSCRRSSPPHQHHSMPNDIMWRAIKRAKIPTHKEPLDSFC